MKHPDDFSGFPESMKGDLGIAFSKLKTFIKMEDKKEFIWTDTLVLEYASRCMIAVLKGNDEMTIDQFKAFKLSQSSNSLTPSIE